MDAMDPKRLLVRVIVFFTFIFCSQHYLVSSQGENYCLDSEPGSASDFLKKASESIKHRHYGEALEDLNTALEADPTLSDAYRQRASVLRQLCRFEESEKTYKKFLELKPGFSAAEKELSQLLQAQSAIAESGFILKENEDNLEALLLRGRAYYFLADHDVALRHYQKGLRLDPEHSDLKKAYFGLKNLLKKTKSAEENVDKGKLRMAVEDFKAALALDPSHTAHNVHLHLGLCKVLVKLGRGKDALSSCTDALSIDEELLEALVQMNVGALEISNKYYVDQRGEAKLLVEDWEGAAADLKAAAQKSPQDMNIREALMRAEKSLKMSQRKDWYKILGVHKTASVAEIKRAYKKLALQWHPDKNVGNREEAEAKFREIAAAYEVLGDDDKRVRYDRGEDIEDMGMGSGGGGFNPFGRGEQQFTFHFEGGFPGGGFPGGSHLIFLSISLSLALAHSARSVPSLPSRSIHRSSSSSSKNRRISTMALTNFILTVGGVSAVVLLLRSDVKQSAGIFRRNVRHIRKWLEEESGSSTKNDVAKEYPWDSKPGSASDFLKKASESIKHRHYGEALEDLNTALEADPTLSDAYRQRASVLRQLCRFEESEKTYKKFLELKPGFSAAEKELSQLLQAQSAIAESGFILKENEDNLEALLLRGRAYYFLADHDVALRHYQKGLRLDPEHSDLKKAYFGLKNLLKKTKSAEENVDKGKLRMAVEDFKAALALDPSHTAHNVHLHLGLCKVLVKLGRGKDALSSCTDALSIDEELLEALVQMNVGALEISNKYYVDQRGEAKLLVEDWEGAAADLKAAAQKSPQDMNIREALMRAEKSLKMSQRKDWYKILGVHKTASVAEIKRAYKKLALQWHPDKNVLGDDDKRVRYDRGEDIEDMGMGSGGGGFNPFGRGEQQFTFHFEGGFPGGGFPGGFGGFHYG
ncbi:hypothetical protein Sjap_013901 [Stephania japonica]|uniref:J domain-containing protein n=1 Tax=Stephania japonica TaxID=461633 RepID=A0AAP0NZG9_9MAGN